MLTFLQFVLNYSFIRRQTQTRDIAMRLISGYLRGLAIGIGLLAGVTVMAPSVIAESVTANALERVSLSARS